MPITDALQRHLKDRGLVPAAGLVAGQWREKPPEAAIASR